MKQLLLYECSNNPIQKFSNMQVLNLRVLEKWVTKIICCVSRKVVSTNPQKTQQDNVQFIFKVNQW